MLKLHGLCNKLQGRNIFLFALILRVFDVTLIVTVCERFIFIRLPEKEVLYFHGSHIYVGEVLYSTKTSKYLSRFRFLWY